MSKNIPYTLPDFTGIFAYKGQSQEWFSARPRAYSSLSTTQSLSRRSCARHKLTKTGVTDMSLFEVLMIAGVISTALFILGLIGELLHWLGYFREDDDK